MSDQVIYHDATKQGKILPPSLPHKASEKPQLVFCRIGPGCRLFHMVPLHDRRQGFEHGFE